MSKLDSFLPLSSTPLIAKNDLPFMPVILQYVVLERVCLPEISSNRDIMSMFLQIAV